MKALDFSQVVGLLISEIEILMNAKNIPTVWTSFEIALSPLGKEIIENPTERNGGFRRATIALGGSMREVARGISLCHDDCRIQIRMGSYHLCFRSNAGNHRTNAPRVFRCSRKLSAQIMGRASRSNIWIGWRAKV